MGHSSSFRPAFFCSYCSHLGRERTWVFMGSPGPGGMKINLSIWSKQIWKKACYICAYPGFICQGNIWPCLLSQGFPKQTNFCFGLNRNIPKHDLFLFCFGLFRKTNKYFQFVSAFRNKRKRRLIHFYVMDRRGHGHGHGYRHGHGHGHGRGHGYGHGHRREQDMNLDMEMDKDTDTIFLFRF
jgi:hypothetical protein